MNLLLMANNGLPRNGLVALYDMGKQIQLGNTGQTLVDFSGRGNNTQLGSVAGADTNDPAYSGQGLTFGADDFCKSSSPAFDDMAQFTCITVFKANSAGGSGYGRIFDKTNRYSGWATKVEIVQMRSSGMDRWQGGTVVNYGTNCITGITYNVIVPDTAPTLWVNATKQTVTRLSTGSGNLTSDATVDLHVGNRPLADRNFDGTIYLQAWYNRILSDAEYLQAYNNLRRLMNQRGITI